MMMIGVLITVTFVQLVGEMGRATFKGNEEK